MSITRPPTTTTLTAQLIPFDSSVTTWTIWLVRYKNYVKLMKIPDKEQELLLNSLSAKPFAAIVSACRPKDPSELTLEKLLKKLALIFTAYSHQITEWSEFFKLREEDGESLVEFANRIRNKMVACEFAENVLENNLSAVFVGGPLNSATKQYLYGQELKTFDFTLGAAIKYEAGQKEGRKNNSSGPDFVNKVAKSKNHKKRTQQIKAGNLGAKGKEREKTGSESGSESEREERREKRCRRCLSWRHESRDCWTRDATCHRWGEEGHIARGCRSRNKIKTVYNDGEKYDVSNVESNPAEYTDIF